MKNLRFTAFWNPSYFGMTEERNNDWYEQGSNTGPLGPHATALTALTTYFKVLSLLFARRRAFKFLFKFHLRSTLLEMFLLSSNKFIFSSRSDLKIFKIIYDFFRQLSFFEAAQKDPLFQFISRFDEEKLEREQVLLKSSKIFKS